MPFCIHALRDVWRLSCQVVIDEKAISVENVVTIDVADSTNCFADDVLDIDHGADRFLADFRDGDFATDNDDVAFDKGFASDAALWIDRQAGVKDGV